MSDEQKWNARYRQSGELPAPANVLLENAHLLPESGRSLDLACGLGANARYLSGLGLESHAWDLSAIAIDRIRNETPGVLVQARDVTAQPPEPSTFDVIVVAHFLDRDLCAAISAALQPGGLLFYQTFSREAVNAIGPGNPAFRLAPNELLRLFGDLRLVVYREEGRIGNLSKGYRDLVHYVGMKL
ncbi:MAG: methyltransferase domain-containing protein [Chromatiales bacterium]|nr:methyltransferase domain-containing protein [Chromatiales bacterium]